MKKYLYVEVRDVTEPGDQEQQISLESVFVEAENEDDAVSAGWRQLLIARAADPTVAYLSTHAQGAFLNDYVKEIV